METDVHYYRPHCYLRARRLHRRTGVDEFATHFCKNPDGSWTCMSAGTFNGPNGRIQVAPGSKFYPGTIFMGFDLAAWLDEQLREEALQCAPHERSGHERRQLADRREP
ncbi:MAG TPA: hypothetical protein VL199_12090 [Burkholderiales bacterium]|nr:hypothetical protein [Burkholderiales bacterium]